MVIAAGDPADRVDQLITLTERLTQRLSEEIGAFEARRPQDAASGSAETSRLANLYRHESARIRADPDLIAGAPEAKRTRLIEATRVFDTVLQRHGISLHAAKTITEGLVHAIAQEVASQRTVTSGYGPRAKTRPGDASAITLNRRA